MSPAPTAAPTTTAPTRSVEVVVEHHRDRLAVHLHGEVDIASHDVLADQLAHVDLTGVTAVDLHLAGLDFCDSHGVRQLLDFSASARGLGCTVTLLETRPQPARLMALLDTAAAA